MSSQWQTYTVLAFYVLAMMIVTIIANMKNRSNQKESAESNSNVITTHFLASKNFGVCMLFLTTFASLFSGYTVVGVPNESGNNGFTAIRWIGLMSFVGISALIIFPRIRRLSIKRSYSSPGDFINDRFNSCKPLCVLNTFCLCVPQLLYLGVQLFSLGQMLSSLTDNQLSFYSIIIIATVLILIFEIIGGMRSVAYTDSIQATIMMIVFIIIPIIITIDYGGFIGQVASSDDLPCSNSSGGGISGCLNYSTNNGIADEYFLRTPSTLTTLNYVLFMLSGLSFMINPHILQRAFAAKEDRHVRYVIICLFCSVFLCQVPGILMGITYISDLKEEYQDFKPFEAILAVFRESGGFKSFLSYIALLAGIAGIMSTADSSLIGVSNTMSCDIFKNWLLPNTSFKNIVLIGKIVSFCTMGLSVLIAIYIYQTGLDFGVLLALQQGILWQAFPSYLFGLHTNINHKSLLFGIIIGIITDIILVILVFTDNNPLVLIDESLVKLDRSWSVFVGVLFNLIACFIGHFCFKWNNKTNKNDKNNNISIDDIRNMMKGINEPLTKYYGVFVWLCAIFAIITIFHWIGPIDADLINKYGQKEVNSFLYNGYVDTVIAGLPLWSFASIIWYVLSAICGIFAALTWSVDLGYDEKGTNTPNTKIEME